MRSILLFVFLCGATVAAQRIHRGVNAANDLGPVDAGFRLEGMTLFLQPSPEQRAALEQLLEDQQNPLSPEYHRWITPTEFAERFGIASGDIAKITAWIEAQGMTVHRVSNSRTWIVFKGTAAQASTAFHTTIHRYRVDNETHYSNTAPPAFPAALAPLVMGMDGLDDFRDDARHPQNTTSAGVHALVPDDWATIYNVMPLYQMGIDGTGQKIAISGSTDFDATALADVATFRSTYNLPPNVPKVVLDTDYPDNGVPASGEAHLDIEWSGAVARNATIIYVHADQFVHAVQFVIDNNLAPVVSMSANNGCEQQTTLNTGFYRLLAQQGNAQGITWVNSGTDAGPAGCDSNGATIAANGLGVRFPSSIPEVTAVGGTEFNDASGTYWNSTNNANGASAISYIPEMVWNDSAALGGLLWAGGGGTSVLFSKPSWQNAPGVPNDGARDLPDVSFTASFSHDGYKVYNGGSFVNSGGTSASAPTFAGLVVLLNQYLKTPGVGNVNPGLYRMARTNPSVFHDITVGNNIVPCRTGTPNCTSGLSGGSFGFSAGPGYDLASGLGSLDATQFVTQWNNQPPQLSGGAVVNGAGFAAGAPVAPGSIISIFGVNLASATQNASAVPLSTTLVDARVTIGGVNAPLFFVSPLQINAQLPFEAALGNQSVIVSISGVSSNAIPVTVAAAAPGIFTYGTNFAAAQHANFQLIGPSSPAAAGETIIVYGTGQGTALSSTVATGAAAPSSGIAVSSGIKITATVGGVNAPVTYAGLTAGLVGLLQVNLQIPSGLASGNYPLVITMNTTASNAATIAVGGN